MTTAPKDFDSTLTVDAVGIGSTDLFGSLPPVLDACCGPRMMWVNKKDPRAIYYDRRNEDCVIKPNAAYPNGGTLKIRPDVQGDFGAMPFPDDSFRLVVFDPPHFTQIGLTGVLGMTYGKLFPDWEDGIAAGFRECFRVLKPEGVLIFKWCSVQIPLERVLSLAPHPPLFGHNTGHRAQTHWMTFMKPNNAITHSQEI
jgi:SAM-dependent methyltransferase